MKKKYLLFLIALFAVVISCTDKSLDPLKFDEIKKGTLLALRGTQLDNIYNDGIPGAEVYPRVADGTEKFAFEAEYLSGDPNSLSSVDYYVMNEAGASPTRVLLGNIPFSQFKNDGKYPHPWVSISFDFPLVLSKLGLNNTFPLSTAVINELLDTYKNGISIVADLNLTDGSKVLADDIVASGLFQSNQFYPAMKLYWTVTEYCAYVANDWGGTWISEQEGGGLSGIDNQNFVAAGTNTWTMDNFFGHGVNATIKFTASDSPSTEVVTYVNDPDQKYQITSEGGQLSGKGTYNSCTGEFSLSTTYTLNKKTNAWVYNFHR